MKPDLAAVRAVAGGPSVVVVGIDPGPTRTAIARVHADVGTGRFRVDLGAHVATSDRWLREVVLAEVRGNRRVGVEQLEGFAYEAKRVAQLVETARAEGRLLATIEAGGGHPLTVPARSWRGELCGSPTASNEQIRILVEGVCDVLPAMSAAAREHVYDAVGVALFCMRSSGVRVVVPPEVQLAMMRQRDAERAERLGRKRLSEQRAASGLPPEPQPSRAPTRAQRARRSEAAERGWARRRGR